MNIEKNINDSASESNLNSGAQLKKEVDLSAKLYELINDAECLFKEGDAFDDKLSEEHDKFPDQDFLKKHDYMVVYYDKIKDDKGKYAIKLRIFGDAEKVKIFINKAKEDFNLVPLSQHFNYGSVMDDRQENGYVNISTIYLEAKEKEN